MTWQQCGLQTWYCPEKKSVNKFNVPSSFQLLSEIGEATASILDSKVGLGFILTHLLIPSAVRPRRRSAVNAIQSYLHPFFPSLNQCHPVLSAAILSKSQSMPSSLIYSHSFQVSISAIQSYLQPFFPSLNQCHPVLSAAILSKSSVLISGFALLRLFTDGFLLGIDFSFFWMVSNKKTF